MPTVGWIQETALERFYESGSDNFWVPSSIVYKCRHCDEQFDSATDRDRHEAGHPLSNPVIYIGNRELAGSSLNITQHFDDSQFYLRNVDYMSVNGESVNPVFEDLEKFFDQTQVYLDVVYGNSTMEKNVGINICIADMKELLQADKVFFDCVRIGGLNASSALSLGEVAVSLTTVKKYIHGLVRFLHGILAKDGLAEYKSYEDFHALFNESSQYLTDYDTALSKAIISIINFNRNNFGAIRDSSVPAIDRAGRFFLGGEQSNSSQDTFRG